MAELNAGGWRDPRTVQNKKGSRKPGAFLRYEVLDVLVVGGPAANLLPTPFSGQGLLDPLLFAGLQVEGVSLDLLDDVLLLDFSLEAAESVLDRLALLNSYFSHSVHTPNLGISIDCDYREEGPVKSNGWGAGG